MQNETEKIHSPVLSEEWNFRNRIRLFLQLAITIASVLLCYLMTLPFLASLSWALALAVLFMPLHRKICRKIRKPTFSAIVTSAIAIIILVIPVLLITIRVVLEIDRGSTLIMNKVESGEWQHNLEKFPYIGKALLWAEDQLDIPSIVDNLTSFLTTQVTSFLKSSFIQIVVIVLTFYLLFVFNAIILILFAFLFEEAADILYYALTIMTFVTIIMVIWDLVRSYHSYNLAYLYEEITPSSPLEFYLAQALESARESQMSQTEEERKRYTDLMDYYTLWVHQIKTPIAASQLLLQDVTDSKTRALLEQEVFKIDSYTNLVLQYLRLENFHDDLQLRQVTLEDLIKEVVRKHSLFFIQKGLTINLHDLDVKVVSDEKWLLVIIEQVLSNSLKYTKSGGIEIYFKDNGLHLKDSGIGIKNSDILRVFERGFSGYNGRLTQQSSGLGLYLSKKIADQLGHDISISSQVGQGTTVSIHFQKQKLAID